MWLLLKFGLFPMFFLSCYTFVRTLTREIDFSLLFLSNYIYSKLLSMDGKIFLYDFQREKMFFFSFFTAQLTSNNKVGID